MCQRPESAPIEFPGGSDLAHGCAARGPLGHPLLDCNKCRRKRPIGVGIGQWFQRLTEHDDKLTATIDLSRFDQCGEIGEAATSNLFVDLGELPTERGGTIPARRLRKVTQRRRDTVSSLKDDTCAFIRGKCTDHASAFCSVSWKESLKAPTRASDPGGDNRREQSRRAGDRDHADVGGDRRSYQLLARVADERSARIADERDRISLQESRDDRSDPVGLFEARERRGFASSSRPSE